MKARAFGYVKPTTLDEAIERLGSGGDIRVLAGGQSLMPALNMRLSSPDTLLDINRIAELRGIERRGDYVRVGALARHADVAESALIASDVPLLAMAIEHVAHPAVRNRGTTCGSIAHADPAAEMPACAVALDAICVLQSRAGRREVPARSFFLGVYETARREDELLIEVLFPVARANESFGFDEAALRHGDFASVGVAVKLVVDHDIINTIDIVIFASEPRPLLCAAAARVGVGGLPSPALIQKIVDEVVNEMEPMDNPQGRADTKRRQARALTTRVLERMFRAVSHGA